MRVAFFGTLLLLAVASTTVGAQSTFIGPSGCVNCHDHARQATQWRRTEPQALKRSHYKSIDALEDPRSAAWARAVGLADPFDLKGSCVRCHATVYKGNASAGVSCESCHGAASGYNAIHQERGAYAKAVAAGLAELRGRPAAIARRCVECHVVNEDALLRAGHPNGRAFDAGESLHKIVHWSTAYTWSQVTAEASKLVKAPASPAVVDVPREAKTAPAPVAATPAPSPTALSPDGVGAALSSDATGVGPRRMQATAPHAMNRNDWWKDVKPLPDDFTIVEDAPPMPRPRVKPRAAVDAAPEAPTVVSPDAAQAPRDLAELRGELLIIVQSLLSSGNRTGALPAIAPPAEFSGPDGELLRLQDEVLVLALELLKRSRP